MGKCQRFTKEFKREAVRLMRQSGRPAAAIARELGIPRNRLYKMMEGCVGNQFAGLIRGKTEGLFHGAVHKKVLAIRLLWNASLDRLCDFLAQIG